MGDRTIGVDIVLAILLWCLVPIGDYWITYYSCSVQEGKHGCITAIGKRCGLGTAAAYVEDFEQGRFHFGELLYVEGEGTVILQDAGLGPRDRRSWIDIWTPNYWDALRKGAHWRTVYQFMPCELAMLGEVRDE